MIRKLPPEAIREIAEAQDRMNDAHFRWIGQILNLSALILSISVSFRMISPHPERCQWLLILSWGLLSLSCLSGAYALYGEVKMYQRYADRIRRKYQNESPSDSMEEQKRDSASILFFWLLNAAFVSGAFALALYGICNVL